MNDNRQNVLEVYGSCMLHVYCGCHHILTRAHHLYAFLLVDVSYHITSCVQVIGQVVRAMQALHEAGYAHSNIKPSSIVKHDTKKWVLSDLSSCQLLGAHTFRVTTLASHIALIGFKAALQQFYVIFKQIWIILR
jgi:serine/threonine protein kinase